MTTNIGVNKVELTEKGILIEWADGKECHFDSRYLRINCSCAECVEEWTNRKLLDPASISLDIKAEDYVMVGRYAVQFLWSDAHYTGIYPFDVLRQLCENDESHAAKE